MCRHQAGELHLVTVAAAVYELKYLKAQWKSEEQQVSPSHPPGINGEVCLPTQSTIYLHQVEVSCCDQSQVYACYVSFVEADVECLATPNISPQAPGKV